MTQKTLLTSSWYVSYCSVYFIVFKTSQFTYRSTHAKLKCALFLPTIEWLTGELFQLKSRTYNVYSCRKNTYVYESVQFVSYFFKLCCGNTTQFVFILTKSTRILQASIWSQTPQPLQQVQQCPSTFFKNIINKNSSDLEQHLVYQLQQLSLYLFLIIIIILNLNSNCVLERESKCRKGEK